MRETARRFRTTVRLDDAVMRLAERTAARLDVSVRQLIESLLLDHVQRGSSDTVERARAPRPRARADVVSLADARRRRRPA